MYRRASITTYLLALMKCAAVMGQTPLPNPDLPVKCPYDIIFVLDESGSIVGTGGATNVSNQIRNGARDLITSLNGTGSRVAVVEFNSTARRAIIGGSINYQIINNAYVAAFNNYISLDNNNTPNANQYDPEDYNTNQFWTNWEDAFIKVQNINSSEDTADLVIFFTDGMPTAYINAGGNVTQGMSAAITQQALLDAIAAANVVKTQGSHIFVVGLPNPTLPIANVEAISGPDRYPVPEPDFSIGDYSVSNSATLQQDLAGLAALLTTNTAEAMVDYEITWSNQCDTFIVEFTDKSTGATSIYWDFGNGFYSSDSSLTHTFMSGGPFIIMLAAQNDMLCGINDTLYDTLTFALLLDTFFTDFIYSYTPTCDSLVAQFSGTSSITADFFWDFGNGSSATGSSASVVYTTPGTYDVTMISVPTERCYKTDTLIKPFTFTPTFFPAHAEFEYEVIYKNDCDTFMVQFINQSTGATDYYWDFGDGAYSTDTNLTHLFSSGGPFIVMLSANNGGACGIHDTIYDTLNFPLRWDTLITDFSYAFQPDCDSLSVRFSASGSAIANFNWDFGNGQTATGTNADALYIVPGTYDVTMIAVATTGCYVNDTMTNPFIFTPVNYAAAADFDYTVIYKNDCDTFIVEFNNTSSGGTSYFWDFGNGITSSDTDATTIYSSGNYDVTLQVNDSRKCSENDTIVKPLQFTPVIVQPHAGFEYEIFPNCDNVELELTNTSADAGRFEWQLNNQIIGNDFSPNAPRIYYQSATLVVNLTAKRINNCAEDDTISKTIAIPAPYGFPSVDFDFSPLIPEEEETISFINLSQRADSSRYQWSFGDGYYSTTVNPQHAYAQKGEYEICLSAENEYGCPDNVCKRLEIIYTPIVELPTAFTPNGDDHNDFFVVRGKDIEKMHLRIFNRWGQLVFESRDPNFGWDGTFKGKPQEMEVYDWLLNATLKNGQDIFRKGNVTLLR